MHIIALDLGGYQATVCEYDTDSGEQRFSKIRSTPQALKDLLVARRPARLVFEIGPQAGWVHDIAVGLSIEVQVANPNHEGWRWRRVKRKTDRGDALKLAQLSTMGQLPWPICQLDLFGLLPVPRTRTLGQEGLSLKFNGTDVAQRRVSSSRIVEALDVVEHVGTSLVTS